VPELLSTPPYSDIDPVTDIIHGVPVTDPYRWLEDQDSPSTREWIAQQTAYARSYLDFIPGRDRIRARIQEFLSIETCDSFLISGDRYFFRKRLPHQEQPSIYVRVGVDGKDELLIDPSERGEGKYLAVKPLSVSPDGRLLLYELKHGGERTGAFELLDIETRSRLPESIPRGYLRGFAFAPDCKSFYYAHEPLETNRPLYRAVYKHVLGTPLSADQQVFLAGEDQKLRLTLMVADNRLVYYVFHFGEKRSTDIYLNSLDSSEEPVLIVKNFGYELMLRLLDQKILALTDLNAPNRRIVEIRLHKNADPEFIDLIPESDKVIRGWYATSDRMVVSYLKDLRQDIHVFTFAGSKVGELPIQEDETVRIVGCSSDSDSLLLETESFTKPINVFHFQPAQQEVSLWSARSIPFDASEYAHTSVWYPSKDGTLIHMFLVGRREVLAKRNNPTIMTSYGGYGKPMTPQFSVFAAYMMERGCLFGLPNIRGGSEFGPEWHRAARRRKRQVAFDDFLAGVDWLENGWTCPEKMAIFGGSNSGLLVGAALTQRPELLRAVVCMVPLLDMLRYHLFDNTHVWCDEFGTADNREDFESLVAYSPYHNVKRASYPAVMVVSGDADRNCNPLHARKMTARLQAASTSDQPIFLDYSEYRGHSPVLPLSDRIDALTDRMAFLCDQLKLPV
jgi:prolyl oligopeptidase